MSSDKFLMYLSNMLNISYNKCQISLGCSYEVSFHVSKNSAQLVEPRSWNTLLCMLMQLTKQDCSHQPALMYTTNYCTVKSLKLFEKMFSISTNVFDTYYNLYFD